MTDDSMIRALAKADGYTLIPDPDDADRIEYIKSPGSTYETQVFFDGYLDKDAEPILPDYLMSHDAILRLVRKLPGSKRTQFWNILKVLVNSHEDLPFSSTDPYHLFEMVAGTEPSDLCETYLRVMELWVDDEAGMSMMPAGLRIPVASGPVIILNRGTAKVLGHILSAADSNIRFRIDEVIDSAKDQHAKVPDPEHAGEVMTDPDVEHELNRLLQIHAESDS